MNASLQVIVSFSVLFSLTIYPYSKFINNSSSESDSTIKAQTVWEINFDDESTTDLVVSEGKLFINFTDGLLYCLDMNGKEKWAAELIGTVHNNSLHYKDLFLAATDEGDLYSINANNGEVLQVIGIGEEITSNLSLIDLPAKGYVNKAVVFGTASGNIYCYDIFTFELIWKHNLTKKKILSTPLVLYDKLIFIDSFYSIFCINAKSGVLIWNYISSANSDLPINRIPIQTQNKIFSLTSKKEIISVDQLSGKKIWSTKPISLKASHQISLLKDELFFIDEKNNLIFLSTKDGKETARIEFKGKIFSNYIFDWNDDLSVIAFSDNSIYRITSDKKPERILDVSEDFVSSLKVLNENSFLVKTSNGKITLYKLSEQ
jgi:outer membrane protein assembly factor BamB